MVRRHFLSVLLAVTATSALVGPAPQVALASSCSPTYRTIGALPNAAESWCNNSGYVKTVVFCAKAGANTVKREGPWRYSTGPNVVSYVSCDNGYRITYGYTRTDAPFRAEI
jgi:hypothetical protein